MLKFFNQNKKLILSFLFWLLSIGLFDLFFYLKKDYNYSNIEFIFLLQIIGIGIISFIIFILTLEQLFHKKYTNLKGRVYSSLFFIFFLILGLGLIFYPLSKFNNKENNIVKETQASKNTLISAGLRLGSNGEDVKILQSALATDKSIYPSGIVSGYYGELTKQAVINFQQKYNLSQTGEIDQQTADKFNEVYGNKTKEYYLSQIPTPKMINKTQINNSLNDSPNIINDEWGKMKQIDDVSYVIKAGIDNRMATPQEIYQQVNIFRQNYGKSPLAWDEGLSNWAYQRALTFVNLRATDKHEGFYADFRNKAIELRFKILGENSLYGGRLEAVHLIEWTFAQDEPHKQNLLSDEYTHIGVGTATDDQINYGVDLIFGGNKF